MALNASIFGNMLNAPKSPEEYLAERQNLQASKLANALNQQKADEYTKGVERQGQLRNLLAGGADSGALRLAGFLGEAADWDKNAALVEKDKAAAAKDTNDANLKTWQAYRDQSSMIRNPQEAVAWITRGYNDPIIGPFLQRFGSLEEGVSRIPQDPADFEQWRMGVGSNVDKMADHAMKQQQLDATIRGQDLSAATQRRWQDIQQGNNIRSNERMIGNGGGGGGGGVAMSRPFELTGEDGQQVVVQQDKQGNIRPVQGFSPKPSAPNAAQQKELMSINQQRSIVNGALNAVTSTPGAFTFKRGVAGKLPFGETLAGRTETPQETQARAYVFNNVSRVINERAGAAQSAQELARLNSFLPADTDGPEQIKNKLNGFSTYLNDLESGTRGKPTKAGGAPQPSNQGPKAGDVDGGYRFKGGDPSNPSNWEKVK